VREQAVAGEESRRDGVDRPDDTVGVALDEAIVEIRLVDLLVAAMGAYRAV